MFQLPRLNCSQLFRYFICPSAMNHEQEYVKKRVTKDAKDGIEKHLEMQNSIEGVVSDSEKNLAAQELKEAFLKIDPSFNFEACVCEEKFERYFSRLYKDENGTDCFPKGPKISGFNLIAKPDLIYISVEKRAVYIVDYKFGYVQVSLEDSVQLMGYALLIKEVFDISFEHFSLNVAIFQDGNLNIKRVLEDELKEFKDKLHDVIDLSAEDTYRPTAIACKWCNHRESCDVFIGTVRESVKKITDTNLQKLSESDMFDFRKHMVQKKKLIEYVLEDSENFFKNNLKSGGFYDFCSLKSNGSVKSWTDSLQEDEILAALLALTGGTDENVFYEKKLKTVSQVKRILGDIPENLIVLKEKAKSLKIKEEDGLDKSATDDLF